MKVLSLIASIMMMASMAVACTEKDSSDVVVTETRQVAQFDRISVSAPLDVNIVCGQKQSLTVTSTDKSIGRIITEVVDGELIIKVEPGHHRIDKKSRVDVCAESLIGLRASGACDIKMPQYTVCEEFHLKVSGASDVLISDLEVKGPITADVSGASDLDLILRADRAVFHVSGASDVDIDRIDSKEVEITASGSSDVDIRGKADNIIVNASGASEVNLRHLMFTNSDFNASGASDIDL